MIFSLDDALRALVPNDGDTWVRIAGWGKTMDVCTHPSPEVEGYMILLRCKGPMRYGRVPMTYSIKVPLVPFSVD